MLKFIAVLVLVNIAATGKRYAGVDNRSGMKRLLQGMTNNVSATCDVFFFSTPRNYKDATKTCQKLQIGKKAKKGNLVTADSPSKTASLMFLFDIAYPLNSTAASAKWVWIGLQKVLNNTEKYKRTSKAKVLKAYDANEWQWKGTGESPVNYSKWPKKRKLGQPDQTYIRKGKQGCSTREGCFQNQVKISQETGYWADSWNFDSHPFACDYEGKYIISGEHLTWERAQKACRRAGLTLAMVRNKRDVTVMKKAMQYFLGDEESSWGTWDNRNWVWLGGNDLKQEGTWEWLNGKAVETWDVPWKDKAGKDNAQNVRKSDGQHVLAFSRDGQFDDSHHKHKTKIRPFACQCRKS